MGWRLHMSVYIIFDAFMSRYKDLLLDQKAKDAETLTSGLDYISDHPWEGNLEATKKFDTVEDLYRFEGLFYQLFDNKSGKRIGYGMVDGEYPAADIHEFEKA